MFSYTVPSCLQVGSFLAGGDPTPRGHLLRISFYMHMHIIRKGDRLSGLRLPPFLRYSVVPRPRPPAILYTQMDALFRAHFLQNSAKNSPGTNNTHVFYCSIVLPLQLL